MQFIKFIITSPLLRSLACCAIAACWASAGAPQAMAGATLADEAPVLFTSNRYGSFDMFSMKPDGTGVQRLTQGSAKNSRGRWSPDGSKVYFIRNDAQVWVIDADGGNEQYLTPGKTFAVSPDGAKLAVSRGGGFSYPEYLYVYELETGNSRVLVQEYDVRDFNPDFSPDGTGIVYASTSGVSPYYYNLRWVNLSGDNKRALTSYHDAHRAFPNAPRFSSDGGLIVFSNRGPGQADFLATIAPDGSGLQSYVNAGLSSMMSPVWSPNGDFVLSSVDGQIVKTDYPSTTAVALTDGSSSDFPTDWFKGTSTGRETAPAITRHPRSQTVLAGANVIFQVSADGNPPPDFQWQLNGTDLDGETGDTLVLNSVTVEQAGEYTVRVRNDAATVISDAAVLTIQATLSLAECLNAPRLPWTTGPAGFEWEPAAHSRDGEGSARSSLADELWNESWIETQVTGPGTLTFWWRIASATGQEPTESDWGMFELSILQGEEAKRHFLGGPACDWTEASFEIGVGVHTLQWMYFPDTDFSGRFVGWLDEVTFFVPQTGEVGLEIAVRQSDEVMEITLHGPPGSTWTIQASPDLRSWSAIASETIPEGGTLAVMDPAAGEQHRCFYRAVAGEMSPGP